MSSPITPNNVADRTSGFSSDASVSAGSNSGQRLSSQTGAESEFTHHSCPGQDGGHGDGSTADLPMRRDVHSMSLVRKSIRMRNRMLPAKTHLKNAQNSTQSQFSAPSRARYPSTFTSSSSDSFPASISVQSIEVDPKESCRITVSPTLSDLSGFLPTPSNSYENMAPAATLRPSLCCSAGAQTDTYGWEAEHDRRAQYEDYETITMS